VPARALSSSPSPSPSLSRACAGFEFPWNPTRLIPFYEGPAYHDYHHQATFGNYAAITPIYDRLFGTVAKGYEAHRAKVLSLHAAKAD
jgi:sterol desaturase/sphingolipid hydroxylase (fatty acid hydroxylase superfamily)